MGWVVVHKPTERWVMSLYLDGNDLEDTSLGMYAGGGGATVVSMNVYELGSAWRQSDE